METEKELKAVTKQTERTQAERGTHTHTHKAGSAGREKTASIQAGQRAGARLREE